MKNILLSVVLLCGLLTCSSFEQKRQFIVTSQGKVTSQIALKIKELGGNIIDSFVAASFAISVERPFSTGIGGGGFLMYFDKKMNKVYSYDFRERAPLAADRDMYLDQKGNYIKDSSRKGVLSVAVPGLVAGLYDIHKKHGKLPWKLLLKPAIELAESGFPVYPDLAKVLEKRKKLILSQGSMNKVFSKKSQVLQLGDSVIQKDLAKTLREIAIKGRNGFYDSWVTRQIVKTVKKAKGILSKKDFSSYQMKTRNAVEGKFLNFNVFSMPPPSSGGIHIIQMLKLAENLLKNNKKTSVSNKDYEKIIAIMQRAYKDRADYLGDADFVKVPVKKLVSDAYLSQIVQLIKNQKSYINKDHIKNPKIQENEETTHFNIVDDSEGMISSTQTINGWWGSGVMAEGTGVILNNEMDDFSVKAGVPNMFGAIGGLQNAIAPQKTPLSSMSPTLIFDQDNKMHMSLGAPGGTRIITCVWQTVLKSLWYKQSLKDAVNGPRIHQQWSPDKVEFEKSLDSSVQKYLLAKGYPLKERVSPCKVQAVKLSAKKMIGVSDSRGEGHVLRLSY